LETPLSEQLIFLLADHLSFAVSTKMAGKYSPSLILQEIRLLYPLEYSIGVFARKLVNEKVGVLLAEDEEGFVALHIVNSNTDKQKGSALEVVNLAQKTLELVRKHYSIIDEQSFEFTRFLVHIKFLAQRVLNQLSSKNLRVEEFAKSLTQRDEKLAKVISEVSDYVREFHGYHMSKEEEVYLMLHVLRITEEGGG